jgi:hypothetical protein
MHVVITFIERELEVSKGTFRYAVSFKHGFGGVRITVPTESGSYGEYGGGGERFPAVVRMVSLRVKY